MSVAADNPPRVSKWSGVGLVGLGAVIVAVNAGLWRPLWIDEFVHFALGGLEPADALRVIYRTTGDGLSHGQTGVYMLFDYLTLHYVGANPFLMRLPSLVAGAVLLFAAVMFFRLKGFSTGWQALVMVALAGQAEIAENFANARPYLVMAASAVAMLAYYQYPMSQRRAWAPRLLGTFGFLVGSVFHPYFVLFASVVLAYSLWEARLRGVLISNRREVIAFTNPWFLVPALALFVVTGLLTWMKGSPVFTMDPWAPYGGAAQTFGVFIRAHEFVLMPFLTYTPATAATVALVSLALVLAVLVVAPTRAVLPPVVLLGLGSGLSLVVTALSLTRSYWVFSRSWMGGIALVTIAIVWLLAVVSQPGAIRSVAGRAVARVGVVLILVSGALVSTFTVLGTLDDRSAWEQFAVTDDKVRGLSVEGRPRDNDAFVELANQNAWFGGPVWPSVSDYYSGYLK